MVSAWLGSASASRPHTDPAATKVAVEHLRSLSNDPGFTLLPSGLRSSNVTLEHEDGCDVSGSDVSGPMITRHLTGSLSARTEGLNRYIRTLTTTGWQSVSTTWFKKDFAGWSAVLVVQPYNDTIEVLGLDDSSDACVWPEAHRS